METKEQKIDAIGGIMKELIKDFIGLYSDMAKDIVDLYSWLWEDNKETKEDNYGKYNKRNTNGK